jgi:hypothetical protein
VQRMYDKALVMGLFAVLKIPYTLSQRCSFSILSLVHPVTEWVPRRYRR